MKTKRDEILKQVDVLFLSFYYFACLVEQNKSIPDRLQGIYHKLGRLTKAYERRLNGLYNRINHLVIKYKKKHKINEVDYLLVSVNVLAEYYEKTKGKKRYFYPMSYENIVELQDWLIETNGNEEMVNNSFEYADFMVKELLK